MKAKEIIDPKTLYLIRTLSRTKRKDYENYVINAIWQKLGNNDLEVVSQQYVENVNNKTGSSHYFIDLYFPALNIGVECDEAYHKNQSKNDKNREVTIFDILYEIKSSTYEAIHIDVTKSFDDLLKSIDETVEKIKQRIEQVKPPKWTIETAEEYYKNISKISISNRKGFNSISKTCNILFNTNRNETSGGASRAYFSLPKFKGTHLEGYKMWFPKLSIQIKDENGNKKLIAATKTGWNNELVEGGNIIIERNDKNKSYKQDGKKRIVFAKYKDPLGYNEYKFVGIFELDKINNGSAYFKRINQECDLLKK